MRRSVALLMSLLFVAALGGAASGAPRLIEGDRGWDCRTLGNGVCGPSTALHELVGLIEGDPGWDCQTMGNGVCGTRSTTGEDLSSLVLQPASTGTTERVSVGSGGEEANGPSEWHVDVSRTGRFVAFVSEATNLVPDDTNGLTDIFVRDRLRGTTERVNVNSDGGQADNDSSVIPTRPSISADGRFVAFESQATNLVEGDSNGRGDVFVRDRYLGTTERVSVSTIGAQADLTSSMPDISADGRFVAFRSFARNLTPEQALDPEPETAEQSHVFVRDRSLGVTERVSVNDLGLVAAGPDGSDGSERPSISGDGRFVAFESDATNLVPDDTNGRNDVFVRDRLLRTTRRASVTSDGEERSERRTGGADISRDGRFVAFNSEADFTAQPCADACVYVRDLSTAAMDQLNDAGSASLRDDGRAAAIVSSIALVAEDTNDLFDVYHWHRGTEALTLMSVSSTGAQGDGHALRSQIFGNGRGVAFSSRATNLVDGDTNGVGDVFVHVH